MTEGPDAPDGVSNGVSRDDGVGAQRTGVNHSAESRSGDDELGETVGQVSQLYLGNLLYAIERCALSLESEDKLADAAFYRGIGRKLAEAHGRGKRT